MIEALQRGAAHESLVCCAAYLLGEYGRQVQQVPLRDQFALLQERFVTVSSEAKVRTAGPAVAAYHAGRQHAMPLLIPIACFPGICAVFKLWLQKLCAVSQQTDGMPVLAKACRLQNACTP